MYVGPGAPAGAAGEGDDVTCLDGLPDDDEEHGIMPVARREAVAVVDFDEVAVAIDPAGHGDLAGRRGADRRAVVDGDVQAFMEARATADGIAAIAEIRRNGTVDGPAGRRRRRRRAVPGGISRNGLLHLPDLVASCVTEDRLQRDEADDPGIGPRFEFRGGQ